MAVSVTEKPSIHYDDSKEFEDFKRLEGLSWIVNRQLDLFDQIARGEMLVKGNPGGGKDTFTASTAKIFQHYFNRPILLDFEPKPLFGPYTSMTMMDILKHIRKIAKKLRVEGIEDSQDKEELAQFMEEATIRWLLEGEGYDIFKNAVWVISELRKLAFNRNPMSRTNKFMGAIGTVWRHLDLLVMGTHVAQNEIDQKAFLQHANMRAHCSQSDTPNLFRVTVTRTSWTGSNFVISNLRLKPVTFWVDGAEPREFLGGARFFDLFYSKHMRRHNG
jgi:hypothetical protein